MVCGFSVYSLPSHAGGQFEVYKSGVGIFVQSMRDVRVKDCWVEGLEERCLEKGFLCFFSNHRLALEKNRRRRRATDLEGQDDLRLSRAQNHGFASDQPCPG